MYVGILPADAAWQCYNIWQMLERSSKTMKLVVISHQANEAHEAAAALSL